MPAKQVHFVEILDGVAILYSLCNKDTKSIAPTTGFNLEMVQMKKFKFDIWVCAMEEWDPRMWEVRSRAGYSGAITTPERMYLVNQCFSP